MRRALLIALSMAAACGGRVDPPEQDLSRDPYPLPPSTPGATNDPAPIVPTPDLIAKDIGAPNAFVAASDGRLMRVALLGGDETIVVRLAKPATTIATAGNYVYYANDAGE